MIYYIILESSPYGETSHPLYVSPDKGEALAEAKRLSLEDYSGEIIVFRCLSGASYPEWNLENEEACFYEGRRLDG